MAFLLLIVQSLWMVAPVCGSVTDVDARACCERHSPCDEADGNDPQPADPRKCCEKGDHAYPSTLSAIFDGSGARGGIGSRACGAGAAHRARIVRARPGFPLEDAYHPTLSPRLELPDLIAALHPPFLFSFVNSETGEVISCAGMFSFCWHPSGR